MTANTALKLIHPAFAQLREAVGVERRHLARALSIESDWRFHDGPEWASRYWTAFADLQAVDAHAAPTASALAARAAWPALEAAQASQTRRIYRALLAALHPQMVPGAGRGSSAVLWPKVQRAYRDGDCAGLIERLHEARRLDLRTSLPTAVVALRAERERLRAAREAADRRLAELSHTFPFCLRDKLADADWIRRQRLALRQIRVLTAAPRAADGHAPAGRKQVS